MFWLFIFSIFFAETKPQVSPRVDAKPGIKSFPIMTKPQVSARVDAKRISPKDTLTLTVEIAHDKGVSVSPPRLPSLEFFKLFSNPSESSEFNMINGRVSFKKKYRYRLLPVKEGEATIGPIEVKVKGQLYKTEPIKVTISSKIKPRPVPQPQPFGGFNRFFNSPFFKEDKSFLRRKNIPAEDIFVQLETSKSKVFINEMLIAKWFVYLPPMENATVEIISPSDREGFWVEALTPPTGNHNRAGTIVNIKGKQYRKKLIMSSALFPIRTGDLKIGAMQTHIRLLNPALFFSPTGGRPILRKSDSKKVKVLPLPTTGQGKNFTGGVGDFETSAKINKDTLRVGDPLVYTITFKGKGRAEIIQLPKWDFGKEWKVYDITESHKFSVSKSVKTFEVILIPQSAGDLILPSFAVNTFDPDLEVYKTHILTSFNIKVLSSPFFKKEQEIKAQKTKEESSNSSPKITDSSPDSSPDTSPDTSLSSLPAPYIKHRENPFFIQWGGAFWLGLFLLLLLSFFSPFFKPFLWPKTSFKKEWESQFKKVDLLIKKGNFQEAGVELNQFMYLFFHKLSHKQVKNWDILLENSPPSLKVKYEVRIKNLTKQLDELSWAPKQANKKLRTPHFAKKLRKETAGLLKTLYEEYKK